VSEKSTDAGLLARCREGDESAWAELVDRFAGYIYSILSRGFRMADHEAEDVFQEVFARLYEKLDSIRDDDAIRAWVGQTTRRLAIDRYRATQREGPAIAGGVEPAEVDERVERLDEALAVRDGLAALSDGCREILTRFFIRDESYATIGEALEIPPGTVASRISRCLAKLREHFGS
jgi:RNA polymerase sigma-70 factor (ECF subfamily)